MRKSANLEVVARTIMILVLSSLLACSGKNKLREQAMEKYNEGKVLALKGDAPSLVAAIDLFKQSVEIDSTFAPGYASMAIMYGVVGGQYGYLAPEKTWPEAIPAANKAIRLDGNLADGYLAKALVERYYNWNWPETEKNLKRALEIEPENVTLLCEYAWFLSSISKTEDATMVIGKAQKIAPESPLVIGYLLYHTADSAEEEKIIQQIKKDIDAGSKNPYLYWDLAVLCSKRGLNEEALKYLNAQIPMMNGDINDEVALLGYNYAILGRKDEAMAQLKRLDELAAKGDYVSPVGKAWIFAGLNNKDEAISCLQKGLDDRSFRMGLDLVDFSFIFKSLADDPGYIEILKKQNL